MLFIEIITIHRNFTNVSIVLEEAIFLPVFLITVLLKLSKISSSILSLCEGLDIAFPPSIFSFENEPYSEGLTCKLFMNESIKKEHNLRYVRPNSYALGLKILYRTLPGIATA